MPSLETVSTDTNKTLQSIMKPRPKPTTEIPTNLRPPPTSFKPKITKKAIKSIMEEMKTEQTPTNLKPYTFKDKENAIMKIINYQNSTRFGSAIKKELKLNYTRDQLTKKNLEALEGILYRIRNFLNARQMNGIYEQMVQTCAMGYEEIVSQFYDIKGFTPMLLSNEAWWDAFERWKLERELIDIPPSFQLAYIIATTTVMAHMKNELEAIKPVKTDEKPPETKEKKEQPKPTKTVLKVGRSLN